MDKDTDRRGDNDASGPVGGTLGGGYAGTKLNLSAAQLHDHESEPSWKAPREKRGISNAALIAIIVVLLIVVLVLLRVAGVI